MQALQSAGIRYAVFVAKLHDGFCLWPPTDYSVKSSPTTQFSESNKAARKYGRKFGVYLSPTAIRQRYKDNLVAPPQDKPGAGNRARRQSRYFLVRPTGSHQAALEVNFATPITFDRALTMEWLNAGQHVQKYTVEMYRGGSGSRSSREMRWATSKSTAFRP